MPFVKENINLNPGHVSTHGANTILPNPGWSTQVATRPTQMPTAVCIQQWINRNISMVISVFHVISLAKMQVISKPNIVMGNLIKQTQSCILENEVPKENFSISKPSTCSRANLTATKRQQSLRLQTARINDTDQGALSS